MGRPLLVGRGGPWPFAGYFVGRLDPTPRSRVCWAGRVAVGDDLELAWRATRAVRGALLRGGPIAEDRRRALSVFWTRLDGVHRSSLGSAEGGDISLLVVAEDAEGAAVSGVGLGAVHAVGPDAPASPWVSGNHPLLGHPGLPQRRPGAITVDRLPPWLVAVAPSELGAGDPVVGGRADGILPRCGVYR